MIQHTEFPKVRNSPINSFRARKRPGFDMLMCGLSDSDGQQYREGSHALAVLSTTQCRHWIALVLRHGQYSALINLFCSIAR